MPKPTRVLFVAEAVTLAHIARPYALARALDRDAYDVVFASAGNYLHLFPAWPWPRHEIRSVSPREFMARLAGGARLYPLATLRQYAQEDLHLIEAVRPDVIVGDFRLSLSATARVAGVPYVALTNAYWSPFAEWRHVPVPCLPTTRVLGVPVAQALFTLARPLAFAWHAIPLNRLRREYGLPSLGLDLRRVYTDADITLYADVPQLVPTSQLPGHHRYIGAVHWSPPIAMPALRLEAPQSRPLVYVALGSSGSASLLPTILQALSTIDCQVAVATCGAPRPEIPADAIVADYLPGDRMAELASVVVCNGGSPTSQQALARGVPVLGIPVNLDQHLNMDHVARYGAGVTVRPEHCNTPILRAAVQDLLQAPRYRLRATELAHAFRACQVAVEFPRALAAATN